MQNWTEEECYEAEEYDLLWKHLIEIENKIIIK